MTEMIREKGAGREDALTGVPGGPSERAGEQAGYTGRLRIALEWLHPVLLLALAVPTACLLARERQDAAVCRLYLAGALLLPCSVVTRAAARRVSSFALWLAVSAGASALCVSAGRVLTGRLFDASLQGIYEVELYGGCLVLLLSGLGSRMNEKSRERARKEQDRTWRERDDLLGVPSAGGLACFAAAYVTALWNNCPPFCDLCLLMGILYLFLLLLHRHLRATEAFLRASQSLTHVPGQKILRLRRRRFLRLTAALLLPAALAAAMSGERTYRDLRYLPFRQVIPREELLFPGQAGPATLLVPGDETFEVHAQPPAWVGTAGLVLAAGMLSVIAALALRAFLSYTGRFRGAPEENGDIALSLEEEEAERLSASRRSLPRRWGAMTGRERVRRDYIRTIRKYRRRAGAGAPQPWQTPAQIESGAAFPEDFPVRELHEAYEEARYSPE